MSTTDLKPGLVEFVSLGKTAHLGPHPKSVAQRQQGHAAEYQCQIFMRKKNVIIMPDRPWPGSTKTANGTVVQQGAAGKYAAVGQRRKRGGKHVRDKHKRRMGRKMEVKVGTLNVGTMTCKGRELADMMKRKVDILCVQETRWKGSKARNIGDGCKIFYHGEDGRRNGVGVILKEDYIGRVLHVDRIMYMKLDIEGVMMTVISAYAPQVGCLSEDKDKFWTDLDEVVESIPKEERLVIGADFNRHVGEGNRGDENVMGRYGDKARNAEGQMLVDFTTRMEMAVVNTYFKKREEHRVTYKSGGRSMQVDYIICRRAYLKEVGDCKVVAGDNVAKQHRLLVCRMTLETRKRRITKAEPRIKWWKLRKEDCCEEFREAIRRALGGEEELPDDWTTTANIVRDTARKVLGVSSKQRKEDKETWWWDEEVQESIRKKRLAKKRWDIQRDEESKQEYKDMRREAKKEVAKAKSKAYDELYEELDTKEGEKTLYRLARQRHQAGKDVQQVRMMKDKDGNVMTDEESVLRIWKEYYMGLMNEENEREREKGE